MPKHRAHKSAGGGSSAFRAIYSAVALGLLALGCSTFDPTHLTFDQRENAGHIPSAHRAKLEKALSPGEYRLLHGYLESARQGHLKNKVHKRSYKAILQAAHEHRDNTLKKARAEISKLEHQSDNVAKQQQIILKKMFDGDTRILTPTPQERHAEWIESWQARVDGCESDSLSSYLGKDCRTGLVELSSKVSKEGQANDRVHLTKLNQAIAALEEREVEYRKSYERRKKALYRCLRELIPDEYKWPEHETIFVERRTQRRQRIHSCSLDAYWGPALKKDCLGESISELEKNTAKIKKQMEDDGDEPDLLEYRRLKLDDANFTCMNAQGCMDANKEFSRSKGPDFFGANRMELYFSRMVNKCGLLKEWTLKKLASTAEEL